MRKDAIYEQLEAGMVTYSGLVSMPVRENSEPMEVLDKVVLPNGYLPGRADMEKLFGGRIPVRAEVNKRIRAAQEILREKSGDLSLYVTYGYRSLEVQTARFLERLGKVSTEKFFDNPSDLYEEVHRSVAVPTVAGHPTGGAVDITIISSGDGRPLDFGSRQYDYRSKDYYTFSPFISEEGRSNRNLLRAVMLDAGFAPFDGEWWHFSYGDREWAFYYRQPAAIYGQLGVEKVRKSL